MTEKAQKRKRKRAKTAPKPPKLDRRSFMRLAGLGAGVVGASAGLDASQADVTETSDASQRSGYRETEHVRTYYRLARF